MICGMEISYKSFGAIGIMRAKTLKLGANSNERWWKYVDFKYVDLIYMKYKKKSKAQQGFHGQFIFPFIIS